MSKEVTAAAEQQKCLGGLDNVFVLAAAREIF